MPRIDRMVPRDQLKPNPRNARTHSRKQIREIANSIAAFGFTAPIITDESGFILAGHGRFAAAELLGFPEVPVVELHGLTEAKKRALALADHKLADKAGWDRERLAIELPELTDLLVQEGLDLTITGFEPVEVDQIATDFEEDASDPADEIDPSWMKAPQVSQSGDLWILGRHRLLCGDARDEEELDRLMDGEEAAAAFLDPPYNVPVKSIVGRGRTKHREFAMASGEMSRPAFIAFLTTSLRHAATMSRDGAVHFVCIDWRHVADLIAAGEQVYGEMLNRVVWAKANAGQGTFYRSQHELIGVFRVGQRPHLNNIELGRHGRSRSNLWRYSGVNSFGANPHAGAPLAPDGEAGGACLGRHEGLHPPRRHHPRYLLWLGHDDPGGRARWSARIRPRDRARLCRCRHPALAGLHRSRRRPRLQRHHLR
jgi:ParB-like nuclease domain